MKYDQDTSLRDKLAAIPECASVDMCFSCGTCVSRCLVQGKVDQEYNPRRLLKMIMMDMWEDAFAAPTAYLCTACDLCYEACPQEIHISAILTNTKQIALQAGYSSPLKTAKVDQLTCVGCGYCENACPYQAITVSPKKVPFRGEGTLVAEVDASKCMGCGVCSVACRSNSIELQDTEDSEVLMDSLWSWFENREVGA